MMKCKNCGYELDYETNECPKCGHSFGVSKLINKKNATIAGASVLTAGASAVGVSKLLNKKTEKREIKTELESIEPNLADNTITEEENSLYEFEDLDTNVSELDSNDTLIENENILSKNTEFNSSNENLNYDDELIIDSNTDKVKNPKKPNTAIANTSNKNFDESSNEKVDISDGTTDEETNSDKKTPEETNKEESNQIDDNQENNTTENNKELEECHYKVEYYYNEQIDSTKTDILSAKINDIIKEYADKSEGDCTLNRTENIPLTISSNESNNVIKVYYDRFEGYGNVAGDSNGGSGSGKPSPTGYDGGVYVSYLSLETAISVLGGPTIHSGLSGAAKFTECESGTVNFDNLTTKLGEVIEKEEKDKALIDFSGKCNNTEVNRTDVSEIFGEEKFANSLLKSLIETRDSILNPEYPTFGNVSPEDAYLNSINEELTYLAGDLNGSISAEDYLIGMGVISSKEEAAELINYATGQSSEYWNKAQNELNESNFKDSELYQRYASLNLNYEQTKQMYESYCDGLAAAAILNADVGLLDINSNMTVGSEITFNDFVLEQFNDGFVEYDSNGKKKSPNEKDENQKKLEQFLYGYGLERIDGLEKNNSELYEAIVKINEYTTSNLSLDLHPGDHIYDLLDTGVKSGVLVDGQHVGNEFLESHELLKTCSDNYLKIIESRTSDERMCNSSFEELFVLLNDIYCNKIPLKEEADDKLSRFYKKDDSVPSGYILDENGLPELDYKTDINGEIVLDKNGNPILNAGNITESETEALKAYKGYKDAIDNLNMYNYLITYTDPNTGINMYSQIQANIVEIKSACLDSDGNVDWDKLYSSMTFPENAQIYLEYKNATMKGNKEHSDNAEVCFEYKDDSINTSSFMIGDHKNLFLSEEDLNHLGSSKDGSMISRVNELTYDYSIEYLADKDGEFVLNDDGEKITLAAAMEMGILDNENYTTKIDKFTVNIGEMISKELSFSLVENQYNYMNNTNVIRRNYENISISYQYDMNEDAYNSYLNAIAAKKDIEACAGYVVDPLADEWYNESLKKQNDIIESYKPAADKRDELITAYAKNIAIDVDGNGMEDKMDDIYYAILCEKKKLEKFLCEEEMEFINRYEEDSTPTWNGYSVVKSEIAESLEKLQHCTTADEVFNILNGTNELRVKLQVELNSMRENINVTDENSTMRATSVGMDWNDDYYSSSITFYDENHNRVELTDYEMELWFARNPEEYKKYKFQISRNSRNHVKALLEKSEEELRLASYLLNQERKLASEEEIINPIASVEKVRVKSESYVYGREHPYKVELQYKDKDGNVIKDVSNEDIAIYFAKNPDEYAKYVFNAEVKALRNDINELNKRIRNGYPLVDKSHISFEDYFEYSVSSGNLEIASRDFQKYKMTLDNSGDLVDWFATTGRAIENGLIGSFSGFANFFDPDGIKSVNDYRGILISQYLTEEDRKFLSASFDITTSLANMAPSIIISCIPGCQAVGLAYMGISSAGSAVEGYLQAGMAPGEAYARGIIKGAMEVGTTYLLGGVAKLGKGATSLGGRLLSKAGASGAVTKIGGTVAKIASNSGVLVASDLLSEGFEEGLQEILDGWIDYAFDSSYRTYESLKQESQNMTYDDFLAKKYKEWKQELSDSLDSSSMSAGVFTTYEEWFNDVDSAEMKKDYNDYKNQFLQGYESWKNTKSFEIDWKAVGTSALYGAISAGIMNSFTTYGPQMVSKLVTGSNLGMSIIWSQIAQRSGTNFFQDIVDFKNALQYCNNQNINIDEQIQNQYLGDSLFAKDFLEEYEQVHTEEIMEREQKYSEMSTIGKILDRIFVEHEFTDQSQYAAVKIANDIIFNSQMSSTLEAAKAATMSYKAVVNNIDEVKAKISDLEAACDDIRSTNGQLMNSEAADLLSSYETEISNLQAQLTALESKKLSYEILSSTAIESLSKEDHKSKAKTSYEIRMENLYSELAEMQSKLDEMYSNNSSENEINECRSKINEINKEISKENDKYTQMRESIISVLSDPSKGFSGLNQEQISYMLTELDSLVLNMFSSDIIENLDKLSDTDVLNLVFNGDALMLNVNRAEILNRVYQITDSNIKNIVKQKMNEIYNFNTVIERMLIINKEFEDIRNSKEGLYAIKDFVLQFLGEGDWDEFILSLLGLNNVEITVDSIDGLTIESINNFKSEIQLMAKGNNIEIDKYTSLISFEFNGKKYSLDDFRALIEENIVNSFDNKVSTAIDSLFLSNGSMPWVDLTTISGITIEKLNDLVSKLQQLAKDNNVANINEYVDLFWFKYKNQKLSISDLIDYIRENNVQIAVDVNNSTDGSINSNRIESTENTNNSTKDTNGLTEDIESQEAEIKDNVLENQAGIVNSAILNGVEGVIGEDLATQLRQYENEVLIGEALDEAKALIANQFYIVQENGVIKINQEMLNRITSESNPELQKLKTMLKGYGTNSLPEDVMEKINSLIKKAFIKEGTIESSHETVSKEVEISKNRLSEKIEDLKKKFKATKDTISGDINLRLEELKSKLKKAFTLEEIEILDADYEVIETEISKNRLSEKIEGLKRGQEKKSNVSSSDSVIIDEITSYEDFLLKLNDPMMDDSKVAVLLDSVFNNPKGKKIYDKIVGSINYNNGQLKSVATVAQEKAHKRFFNTNEYFKKFGKNLWTHFQRGSIDGTAYFEHIGIIQDIEVSDRLYLNLRNYADVYKFTEEFSRACEEAGLYYYFKIGYAGSQNGKMSQSTLSRDESIVIYSDKANLVNYLKITNQILKAHPEFVIDAPPILTSVINGKIGYGAEPRISRASFNSIRGKVVSIAIDTTNKLYYQKYGKNPNLANIKNDIDYINMFKSEYNRIAQMEGLDAQNTAINAGQVVRQQSVMDNGTIRNLNKVFDIIERIDPNTAINRLCQYYLNGNANIITRTDGARSIIESIDRKLVGEYLEKVKGVNPLTGEASAKNKIAQNTATNAGQVVRQQSVIDDGTIRNLNKVFDIIEKIDPNTAINRLCQYYLNGNTNIITRTDGARSLIESIDRKLVGEYLEKVKGVNPLTGEALAKVNNESKALNSTSKQAYTETHDKYKSALQDIIKEITLTDEYIDRIMKNHPIEEIQYLAKLEEILRGLSYLERNPNNYSLEQAVYKKMYDMHFNSDKAVARAYGKIKNNLIQECYLREYVFDGINVKLYASSIEECNKIYDNFKKMYSKLPKFLSQILKEVKLYDSISNPFDMYWTIAYNKGINNTFNSLATGGEGGVNFWNISKNGMSLSTLFHEMGHNLDFKLGNGSFFTKTAPNWNEAKIRDGRKVSDYGEKSIIEDFADSVKRFYADYNAFKQECPNRCALLEEIIGDQIIKESTTFNELMEEIIKTIDLQSGRIGYGIYAMEQFLSTKDIRYLPQSVISILTRANVNINKIRRYVQGVRSGKIKPAKLVESKPSSSHNNNLNAPIMPENQPAIIEIPDNALPNVNNSLKEDITSISTYSDNILDSLTAEEKKSLNNLFNEITTNNQKYYEDVKNQKDSNSAYKIAIDIMSKINEFNNAAKNKDSGNKISITLDTIIWIVKDTCISSQNSQKHRDQIKNKIIQYFNFNEDTIVDSEQLEIKANGIIKNSLKLNGIDDIISIKENATSKYSVELSPNFANIKNDIAKLTDYERCILISYLEEYAKSNVNKITDLKVKAKYWYYVTELLKLNINNDTSSIMSFEDFIESKKNSKYNDISDIGGEKVTSNEIYESIIPKRSVLSTEEKRSFGILIDDINKYIANITDVAQIDEIKAQIDEIKKVAAKLFEEYRKNNIRCDNYTKVIEIVCKLYVQNEAKVNGKTISIVENNGKFEYHIDGIKTAEFSDKSKLLEAFSTAFMSLNNSFESHNKDSVYNINDFVEKRNTCVEEFINKLKNDEVLIGKNEIEIDDALRRKLKESCDSEDYDIDLFYEKIKNYDSFIKIVEENYRSGAKKKNADDGIVEDNLKKLKESIEKGDPRYGVKMIRNEYSYSDIILGIQEFMSFGEIMTPEYLSYYIIENILPNVVENTDGELVLKASKIQTQKLTRKLFGSKNENANSETEKGVLGGAFVTTASEMNKLKNDINDLLKENKSMEDIKKLIYDRTGGLGIKGNPTDLILAEIDVPLELIQFPYGGNKNAYLGFYIPGGFTSGGLVELLIPGTYYGIIQATSVSINSQNASVIGVDGVNYRLSVEGSNITLEAINNQKLFNVKINGNSIGEYQIYTYQNDAKEQEIAFMTEKNASKPEKSGLNDAVKANVSKISLEKDNQFKKYTTEIGDFTVEIERI